MHFSYHSESYQTYSGGVTFSNYDNSTNLIEVGTFDIASLVSHKNLTADRVNPFVLYKLNNLQF